MSFALLICLHATEYGAALPVVQMTVTTKVFAHAGFNVETVEYKNISFTVWDVGGQDKVCSRLPHGNADTVPC
jgi:GTPase SAR1 family protein